MSNGEHPTGSELFDCLDRHGHSYERLDLHELSALMIAGKLSPSDPVRVHASDHWATIGQWFDPPENPPKPPPSIKTATTERYRAAPPPESPSNPQSLKGVIIICTAVITTAILIAAVVLRDPPPPPPSLADPIRRSQLEEIVHLANRNIGDGYGGSDYIKFRPAIVALENFQTLNSSWLASRTNIQESLDEALFNFKRAIDVVDGPIHQDGDYKLFILYRSRGMQPLIKAVNEL